MSLSDDLSSQLIEEGPWCIFAESSHCIHIHIMCGDRSTFIEDQMILSNGYSSQAHWRRFVMHLCRTFSLFTHLYQSVATKWGLKRTPRGGLSPEKTPAEFISTSVAPSLFAGDTLHYIQSLWWLKDRGNSWHLSLMKNPWQLIILRGIAWLA